MSVWAVLMQQARGDKHVCQWQLTGASRTVRHEQCACGAVRAVPTSRKEGHA